MPTYSDFLRALGGHREKHLAVEKGIYESLRADAGGRGSDLGVKRISNQSADMALVHSIRRSCLIAYMLLYPCFRSVSGDVGLIAGTQWSVCTMSQWAYLVAHGLVCCALAVQGGEVNTTVVEGTLLR